MNTKLPNKTIVTEAMIAQFNDVRQQQAGIEMTGEQIKTHLAFALNRKIHSSLFKSLADGENPPIIRVKRGKYVFNPKPVYIERLQAVFDAYTKNANPRQYKTGKYTKVTIEEAIAILKENGYKVYRQIIKYEEV